MESTPHMSSSIELRIGSYGIDSEMFNEVTCIDGMGEY